MRTKGDVQDTKLACTPGLERQVRRSRVCPFLSVSCSGSATSHLCNCEQVTALLWAPACVPVDLGVGPPMQGSGVLLARPLRVVKAGGTGGGVGHMPDQCTSAPHLHLSDPSSWSLPSSITQLLHLHLPEIFFFYLSDQSPLYILLLYTHFQNTCVP